MPIGTVNEGMETGHARPAFPGAFRLKVKTETVDNPPQIPVFPEKTPCPGNRKLIKYKALRTRPSGSGGGRFVRIPPYPTEARRVYPSGTEPSGSGGTVRSAASRRGPREGRADGDRIEEAKKGGVLTSPAFRKHG